MTGLEDIIEVSIKLPNVVTLKRDAWNRTSGSSTPYSGDWLGSLTVPRIRL